MRKLINMVLFLGCMFLSANIFAQTQSVTGTVTDTNGEPVAGATVRVPGTQIGAITDIDGNFRLDVPDGTQTVVVSFIGMEAQTINLDGDPISVSLSTDSEMLEEVVVTALGIEREARKLSYSATEVQGEELVTTANQNILSGLSGKVAGVNILNNSGAPGSSSNIAVRGFQSVTGSNNVLVVIDGVPQSDLSGQSRSATRGDTFARDYGNSLTNIDPNNIESINLLKGTAATALYGTIARNGALIVTTKKGSNDGLKVTYSGNVDMSEVGRLPQYQNEFGQGWNGSDASGNLGTNASNENGSWGPGFDGKDRVWGSVYNNSQQVAPYIALPNNLRDFYENGSSFTNSIVFSNGSEKSNYKLSYSNTNSNGVVPTNEDKLERHNLGFKGGLNLDNGWNFQSSVNYIKKNQSVLASGFGDDASYGAALFTEILQIPRNISIQDLSDPTNPFNSASYYFTPYARNPYESLANNQNDYEEDDISVALEVGKDIGSDFNIFGRFGGRFQQGDETTAGNLVNFETGSPQDAFATPIAGAFGANNLKFRELNSDILLSYDKELNTDMILGLKLGNNINQVTSNAVSGFITNLTVPGFYDFTNTTVAPIITDFESTQRKMGVYMVADWEYKDWLFVTATGRQDWSSTLPEGNRGFFYPSFGIATDLARALELPNAINYLKLRASYGQTGNSPRVYSINAVSVPGNNIGGFGNIIYPFGGVSSFEVGNQVGNPNLVSELTSEIELGGDIRLFDNRLGLDIAFYNKETDDQILTVPLALTSGFSNITTNIGTIRNRGVELALNTSPVEKEDWGIDLNYVFSKNENEVISLSESLGVDELTIQNIRGVALKAKAGLPVGYFETPVYLQNAAGQVVVDPNTGRPLQDPNDQIRGDIHPDFTMGIQPKIRYKGFELGSSVDWSEGGTTYSYTSSLSHFTGNHPLTAYNGRNAFIVPNSVNQIDDGMGNITYEENVTPVTFTDITNFYNPSQNPGYEQFNLLDKTFIRMRDLYLTYSAPTEFASKLKASNMSMSLYGRNIFLWTPSSNGLIDPESSSYGTGLQSYRGEYGAYPNTRSVGIKLNVGF